MEREYHARDASLLSQLGAPLDDPGFRALYFKARDVWNRLHAHGGDLKQESLHMLVVQWELGEEAKAKPAKGKAA